MKTLLILRHAKSSWNHPNLADHDRPLNKRGQQDAPRVGQHLQEQDLVPDLIITSTAKRARSTAMLVAEASGYEAKVIKNHDLYHADPEDHVEVLQKFGVDHDRVMLVGHNTGLEELIEQLTGRAETLSTASLAQVSLPIDSWASLTDETTGTLVNLWQPKELG